MHKHGGHWNTSRFEAANVGSRGTGAGRYDGATVTTDDASSLPPFYTLVYIMKQ